MVDLNGDSGDDTFVVRSFIALVIAEDGTVLGSDSKKVTAIGGDDNDKFDIKGEGNNSTENGLTGTTPNVIFDFIIEV